MYQKHGLAAVKQPQPKKGTKVKTQTYATETEAKNAAAMAYRPAILLLANGRYACFQAGQPLPRGSFSLEQLPSPLTEDFGQVVAAERSEAGPLVVDVVEVQRNHPVPEER